MGQCTKKVDNKLVHAPTEVYILPVVQFPPQSDIFGTIFQQQSILQF